MAVSVPGHARRSVLLLSVPFFALFAPIAFVPFQTPAAPLRHTALAALDPSRDVVASVLDQVGHLDSDDLERLVEELLPTLLAKKRVLRDRCRPKRIILVRHGESEGNKDRSAYSQTPDSQIQLTRLGKLQGEAAGTQIRTLEAFLRNDWLRSDLYLLTPPNALSGLITALLNVWAPSAKWRTVDLAELTEGLRDIVKGDIEHSQVHQVMAPKTAPKAKADPKPKAESKAKAKVKKEEQEDEKPKVPQPNKEEFDAKSEKIQEEIQKLQDKQKKLTEKIQERSGGKEEFYAKKAELRAQLDVITDKINGLMEKKDEINKAVGNKREEGREMRSQLNSMKKTVGFTSQQEINNRIATIEFQLCTESVPLKEEKKLLAEIQTLKKNRSKVDTMNTMEQNLANFDPGMSMKEQKEAINADISQFRDEKKKIQDQMTELSEARKTQLGPIEEIQNERNAIGDKLRAKIEERNALRDEYRQQEREYWAYQQELRKARQERYAAEKAEKQKEYDLRRKQREAEKLDEQPYVAEITLIEQTIKYCKGLVQSKVEEKKDEKKEVAYNNPDGAEILLRKEDRDEEFYFAPTKAGKKGKAKNKGGDAKPNKITHNAETFRLFDQLKLDAPLSTDQVPGLLEELEKQLGEFQGKVKEWEEKREEMKKAILEGLTEIEQNKAAREADEKEEAAEETKEEEKAEETKDE
ncbi:unnamed protein product [Symbiodinium sp. CCMP2592]|nr:unnamed protein product [Symbiodinium sp. CCMP2592]